MTLSYSYSKHVRKDGSLYNKRRPYYICYGKENGRTNCTSKGYIADKIEGAVIRRIYEYLEKINREDISKAIKEKNNKNVKKYTKELKELESKIKISENDLHLLKEEILKVIKGESLFTPELLKEQIAFKEEEIARGNNKIKEIGNKIVNIEEETQESLLLQKSLLSWKEAYEKGDIETKKMLLIKIIKRIDVSKGNIELEVKYQLEELWGKI
jgi:hypothetical protein